jgi:hypothetical protein
MFFSLQIDRGNLTQAVSGTFLKDLKLSTNGTTPHLRLNYMLTSKNRL